MAFTIRSTDPADGLILGHYGTFDDEAYARRVARNIPRVAPIRVTNRYEVVPVPAGVTPNYLHPAYLVGMD